MIISPTNLINASRAGLSKAFETHYINDRILATGQLIETIEYHVDCENTTNKWFINNQYYTKPYLDKEDTTKIDYYTEEEFVMAYIERCIE